MLRKELEKFEDKFVGCYMSTTEYFRFLDEINKKRLKLKTNYTISDALREAVKLFVEKSEEV